MVKSRIVNKNGNHVFEINGKEYPACAYVTYFEENNDYKLFADNGYKLYSVNVSLSYMPINTTSEFTPFVGGVFDNKNAPDFSAVDESIRMVLRECPDCYIFPRIYVTMPGWWVEENPTETIPVSFGKRREALYSDKFRKDAEEMLRILIRHIESSDYADRIFAYQISGGNTQEWFHFDLNGSFDENALPYFNRYLKENHPHLQPLDEMFDIGKIKKDGFIDDEIAEKYVRFVNDSVADVVEYFCKVTKEETNGNLVVGAFYGYTLEVTNALLGTHSLARIIDSPYIDFFSSPNSYNNSRSLGCEWGDMMPVDSMYLYGKMCFMECDIRTHLTKYPSQSREGCDKHLKYNVPVFLGPDSPQKSLYALDKSLARQITHRHSVWWFDMFGHWYESSEIMEFMRKSLGIYETVCDEERYDADCETVLFVDEKMYSKIGMSNPCVMTAFNIREALTKSGIPYKIYLIEDFEKVLKKEKALKAVVFAVPSECELCDKAQEELFKKKVAFLRCTNEKWNFTPKEMKEFLEKSGVMCYTEEEDVFYIGNGFMAIHASFEGEKKIKLPAKVEATSLDDENAVYTSDFSVNLKEHETRIYTLKKRN